MPDTQPLDDLVSAAMSSPHPFCIRWGDAVIHNIPVLPTPRAMVLDLDPGTAAQLALGDLLGIVFADLVLTASPVVGRQFCMVGVLAKKSKNCV